MDLDLDLDLELDLDLSDACSSAPSSSCVCCTSCWASSGWTSAAIFFPFSFPLYGFFLAGILQSAQSRLLEDC